MNKEKFEFYEKYKKYVVKPEEIGFIDMEGVNYKFVFNNGYGASVIRHYGSYGYELGLFEVAVLIKYTDEDYHLCYSTPITDDVIGCLTDEQVIEVLEKIKQLEAVE